MSDELAGPEDWLSDAGFSVVWVRFIPEGDGGHTLVLARPVEGPVT